MSKVVICSDLHIYPHKKDQRRVEDCLEALSWIFQTAQNHNIQTVIFLGDLFHDRYKIQVYAYNRTFQILNSYPNIKTYILLGNHDLWYYEKTDISSVMPFSAIPNVAIIDKPTTIVIDEHPWDFLPFVHNPKQAIENNFVHKSKFLGAHIAINKAVLNKFYNTLSEVSIENSIETVNADLLSDWQQVFLGHFHCPQQISANAEYVGSALQLEFGDAFQDKHIILFDQATLQKDYIINDFSPKHFILNLDNYTNYNLANAYVQLEIDEITTDLLEIKQTIPESVRYCEFRKKDLKPNQEFKQELQSKFNLVTGDILDRYIAAKGCNVLNKDLLLQIGRGICSED